VLAALFRGKCPFIALVRQFVDALLNIGIRTKANQRSGHLRGEATAHHVEEATQNRSRGGWFHRRSVSVSRQLTAILTFNSRTRQRHRLRSVRLLLTANPGTEGGSCRVS